MDMNQLIEMQQSVTFLGSIGGLALALLGAGLAADFCSGRGGVLFVPALGLRALGAFLPFQRHKAAHRQGSAASARPRAPASPVRRAPACCARTPENSAR